jgi:hypothetical protein
MTDDAIDAGPVMRRRLVVRWILAGVLVPTALGGASWLGYGAGLGFLAEGLAGPAMFSAPMSPFLVSAFTIRGLPALQLAGVVIGVVTFQVVLYGALGLLHARLRRQPPINRALWLTVAVLVTFAITSFLASIWAFSG